MTGTSNLVAISTVSNLNPPKIKEVYQVPELTQVNCIIAAAFNFTV